MLYRSVAVVTFVLLSMIFSLSSWGQDKTMEKEWLLSEDIMVISAAKFEQPLSEAPAVMSIVTDEDIKQMGARDLKDVLQAIPNISVDIDYLGRYGTTVRGVKTVYSEKVKLLINGHSVNDPLYGGATWTYDDLVVDNIKRIEIIRGPGSALYGTNAFVGVINIITKEIEDINGYQVSANAGSFKSQGASLLFGKKLGELGINGYAEYKNSDGPKMLIEKDALFGAPFSHSPGLSNRWIKQKDFNLALAYKNFDLKTKLTDGERGPYLGLMYAVNDETVLYKNQMFAELSHKYSGEAINLLTKIYWDQFRYAAFYEGFSEGFTLSYYGVYPDGWLGTASVMDRTLGLESQAIYEVNPNNKIVGGIVFEDIKQIDATYALNFHPLTYAPYGFIKDISGELNWQKRGAKRDVYALYFQDTYRATQNIILTIGTRYDHYNDFGQTINPRASMVWKDIQPKTTLKVLYGTAFRAPNFGELYSQNNPAVVGNLNLEPEKIRTAEANVTYDLSKTTKVNGTYFDNTINDLITIGTKPAPTQPALFINKGSQRVKGGEIEVSERFGSKVETTVHYALQKGKDVETGLRLADVPVQKAGVRAVIDVSQYVTMGTDILYFGQRLRASNDTRVNLGGYALVNLTATVKNVYKGLEISTSVQNALDRDYVHPSPASAKVPGDFPQQGIDVLVKATYTF